MTKINKPNIPKITEVKEGLIFMENMVLIDCIIALVIILGLSLLLLHVGLS